MICANTHTRLRIAAALGSAVLALCAGCASRTPAPQTVELSTVSSPSALVFSSEPVRNWHASNAGEQGVGLIAADRFEYSRNDARLTPASRAPLLATRQWPEPPRPLERPVRFWRWQQR